MYYELHLSQEQLAEIADVHRNFVGKVERGEQNVSIDSLMRLATSLKTPLSTIISDAGL
jgi:transcriptional regulator with XRE-family HTH domain